MKRLRQENGRLPRAVSDLTLDKLVLKESGTGKLLSSSRRRRCVDLICSKLDVSERRARCVLGQHRSTPRHVSRGRADNELLVSDMTELARQYGRHDYHRIADLLRDSQLIDALSAVVLRLSRWPVYSCVPHRFR
jgi:hypothetical protein